MTSSTSARSRGRSRRPADRDGAASASWDRLRLPPGVRFLPAAADASGFAERLYLETMRPLLQRLDAWDERAMIDHFRAGFVAEQVRVIQSDGVEVGYLQVLEADEALTILQIHLLAAARGHGLGTAIIRALLDHAGARAKDVLLSVVRHNPAIALYRRLGFELAAEDALRLHMRWRADRTLPNRPAGGAGKPLVTQRSTSSRRPVR